MEFAGEDADVAAGEDAGGDAVGVRVLGLYSEFFCIKYTELLMLMLLEMLMRMLVPKFSNTFFSSSTFCLVFISLDIF